MFFNGQNTIYGSMYICTYGSLCMCLASRSFNRYGKLFSNGVYNQINIICVITIIAYYLLEHQCCASSLWIIVVQSRQDFSKKFKFYLIKESNTNNHLCFYPSTFIITILCIGKISQIKKIFLYTRNPKVIHPTTWADRAD